MQLSRWINSLIYFGLRTIICSMYISILRKKLKKDISQFLNSLSRFDSQKCFPYQFSSSRFQLKIYYCTHIFHIASIFFSCSIVRTASMDILKLLLLYQGYYIVFRVKNIVLVLVLVLVDEGEDLWLEAEKELQPLLCHCSRGQSRHC